MKRFLKKSIFYSMFVTIVTLFLTVSSTPATTYASVPKKCTDDAYEFYHKYKDDSLIQYNEDDGCIYFCNRGKLASNSKAITYGTLGNRYFVEVNNKTYYVETLRGDMGGAIEETADEAYDKETGNHGDDYYYVLYKIDYYKLIGLLEVKYPNADFSDLFTKDKVFTITIDSLMTVYDREKNPEGEVVEELKTDGKYNGKLKTKGDIYYTEEEMTKRWYYNEKDFSEFFNIKLKVKASVPTLEVSSLSVDIDDSDAKYLYKKSSKYYVKKGKEFELKFTTTTSFSNDTMQPHISILNAKSDGNTVDNKVYLVTKKNSNNKR